jgi:hypothetical protein
MDFYFSIENKKFVFCVIQMQLNILFFAMNW